MAGPLRAAICLAKTVSADGGLMPTTKSGKEVGKRGISSQPAFKLPPWPTEITPQARGNACRAGSTEFAGGSFINQLPVEVIAVAKRSWLWMLTDAGQITEARRFSKPGIEA